MLLTCIDFYVQCQSYSFTLFIIELQTNVSVYLCKQNNIAYIIRCNYFDVLNLFLSLCNCYNCFSGFFFWMHTSKLLLLKLHWTYFPFISFDYIMKKSLADDIHTIYTSLAPAQKIYLKITFSDYFLQYVDFNSTVNFTFEHILSL